MSLRPSLEEFRQLGQHMTTYNWGIQFLGLPSALTGFSSADLNTRARSTTLPSRSIEPIELRLRGHKAFQPGMVNYGNTLSITLYETIDTKVQDFLNAYTDLLWTPVIGTSVPKLSNQCSFLLTLLDSEDKAVKYYTIIGAWLQDFKPSGDLQSDSSTVLEYNAIFQYDYYL